MTAGFVVAVAVFGAVTFDAGVSANNRWGNKHWERSSNPLVLTLRPNFTDGLWDSSFTTALGDWNASDVLSLTEETSAPTSLPSVCHHVYTHVTWTLEVAEQLRGRR